LDARCNRAVSDAQRAHEQHDEQQRRHAAQLRDMELRGAEAAQEAIFYRDEANIAQRRCNELETEMRDLRVQIQTRPMSAIGSPNNASALTEKLKKAEKECAQNAELASRWEDRYVRIYFFAAIRS
jgi:predicted  nucleic acid-binding Zn-ribbon protein